MKPGLCPDLPFYPADWLSSTRVSVMSLAEQGAFVRLLCHSWAHPECCLPDDDRALAELSQLREAWKQGSGAVMRACFEPDPERPGWIFNRRLRSEREKQQKRIGDRRNRGRAGAAARWKNERGPSSCRSERPASEIDSEDAGFPAPQASLKHDASTPQASNQHAPDDASSPITPLPSHVSQRESEVGPPPGFPRSEEEAMGHVACVPDCTREFAVKVWNEAMARGGRDIAGNPVFNFRAYLAGRVASEKARASERKIRFGRGGGGKPDHSKGF